MFERNKNIFFSAGCRAAVSIRDTENRRLQFREYAATVAAAVAAAAAAAAVGSVAASIARKRNILKVKRKKRREGKTGTIFFLYFHCCRLESNGEIEYTIYIYANFLLQDPLYFSSFFGLNCSFAFLWLIRNIIMLFAIQSSHKQN